MLARVLRVLLELLVRIGRRLYGAAPSDGHGWVLVPWSVMLVLLAMRVLPLAGGSPGHAAAGAGLNSLLAECWSLRENIYLLTG